MLEDAKKMKKTTCESLHRARPNHSAINSFVREVSLKRTLEDALYRRERREREWSRGSRQVAAEPGLTDDQAQSYNLMTITY